MERRFHCTACGKCCFGRLPLTLGDAVAHAHRFPLALVWTPVRQGAKSFALASRLGPTFRLPNRQPCAVLVVPTAFIPPAFSCPALQADGLCGVQDEKPLRCRTMPFYPWREEADQADLLVPRKDWLCDTGASAPVVYRDRTIVDRADFDRERAVLLEDAAVLTGFAESLMKGIPGLVAQLVKAAMRPMGGGFHTDFASLLPKLKTVDRAGFALRQHPVLLEWAERMGADPALAEHRRSYAAWAEALARHLPKAEAVPQG